MDTTGKRKDAAYMRQLHQDLAAELTHPEGKDNFLGTVMDNTGTNMNASKQLELDNPTWLCIGFIAHAFNLLCKDLAKGQPKKKAKRTGSDEEELSTDEGALAFFYSTLQILLWFCDKKRQLYIRQLLIVVAA